VKRKLLIVAGVLAALVVAAAIAVPLLFDVERYRPDIEQAIASATGRSVKVGPLRLTFFPVTELTAAGFTIGEDPRFGAEPFLQADRLVIRVRLWPLLSRHLAVDSLAIEAPRVSLARDAQGNWGYATLMQGPGGKEPPASPGGPPGGTGGKESPGPAGFTFSVHSLRLAKGSVIVSQGGRGTSGSPSSEVKEINLSVDDIAPGSIGRFDLSFTLQGGAAARLSGTSLSLSPGKAEIKEFTASLGRSSVSGACTVTRFERPILDVRLASPLLDLDEMVGMFPASPGTPQAAVRVENEIPVVVPARAESGAASGGPSLLRDMTVRGDLSVEKIHVMNLSLASARAKLSMERGEARLSGISVSLYKGSLSGDLSAGVVETGPPFTLQAKVQGVDFNAFATDFSKDLKGLIYGTLGAGLDVQGRGLDTPGLRRNLHGTGSLDLRDGKLTSIAALKMLAKALEAAGGKGVGADETPFKSLTGTFTIAGGLLRTDDLALDSPDIDMAGKGRLGLDLTVDLDVATKISEPVSNDMIAKTPTLKYLVDKKGRLEADLHLGGTLAAPSVGVDPQMLQRAAKNAGKEQLQKQGKGFLDKLLKKKN
jgi:uncharacterized protein involved in outer membrane biogenesis